MPAENHLTAEELAELRLELIKELARLERTMPTSEEAARPVQLDQSSVGRLSRIDALQNQQIASDLHSRSMERHALLTDALARMDEGVFGRCQHCDAALPFGRLLVFPEARSCVPCGARGLGG